MYSKSVIWLHDEALRAEHPVFKLAPAGTPSLYIWDNEHLQAAGYSFKRLLFVYETLLTLPVTIVRGTAPDVFTEIGAGQVYVAETVDPYIKFVASQLSPGIQFIFVEDEPFVQVGQDKKYRRFFQYWNDAQDSALSMDGRQDRREVQEGR